MGLGLLVGEGDVHHAARTTPDVAVMEVDAFALQDEGADAVLSGQDSLNAKNPADEGLTLGAATVLIADTGMTARLCQ